MEKFCTYQSVLTTDGTSMCPTDISVKRGDLAPPGGWKDHNFQCEECVCAPLCIPLVRGGPLLIGGGKLPKMGAG